MRKSIVAVLVLVGLPIGQAAAQCSGTALSRTALDAFGGNTICGAPGAGYSGSANDRWQEEHLSLGAGVGELYDYKLGPSNAMDPRERVGTWRTNAGASGAPDTITHVYNGGGTYTYSVYLNGGIYSFCNGTTEVVRALLQPGTNAACTSYPGGAATFGARKR